jgi:putative pyoverdin transport system ATP-binding/permease protein
MNVIWLLLKASWVNVTIAICAGLVSGGCSVRLIALINTAIRTNHPAELVWQFSLLAAITLIARLCSQFLLIKLAQGSVYDLRLSLSRAILAAPLQRLEELGAEKLLATLTGDVTSLSNSISIIPFFCIDLATIAGCLIYLASLSGPVFLMTIVLIIISVGIIQMVVFKASGMFAAARTEDDRLVKNFRAIIDGIKELKLNLLRRQAFIDQDLSVSAASSQRHNIKALELFSIADGFGQLIFFIIIGSLLFLIPTIVSLNPTTLSAFALTLTYLMLPFQNIVERLPLIFRASVALDKIDRMGLKLADQIEQNHFDRTVKLADSPQISLSQISHTYAGDDPDSRFRIGPIDLSFKAGQLVFLIGGNGSGKSTLAKIITGLYLPQAGELRFNDRLITDADLEWYRQHFAVIFSDFHLFDRLIGIEHPELDQRATIYLETLHLDSKVQIKDGVLSTTSLSQGQRKRLALLTAYLEDRPIYLFDEWAADQDPLFRDIFYHQLLPELRARGKLIIAISHDDRYFHLADRVIKLDYGKVEFDLVNTLE